MPYAFAQNWNAFAEYRYTRFGSSTISLPFSQLTTTSTTNVSAIEFGVNYKFNSGAPSVERTGSLRKTAGTGAGAGLQGAARPAFLRLDWRLSRQRWRLWFDRSKGTLTTAAGAPLAPYSYSVNGPFAGIFVGGNYQFDRFVVGVEGDWQRANLTGNNQQEAALGAVGTFPGGPFTISTTIKDYEFGPRPVRHRA